MPDTALDEGNQFEPKVIVQWNEVRIKSGDVPKAGAGVEHTFSQYSILLSDRLAARRDEVRERLDGAGVATAVYYPRPLHQQPVFSGLTTGPLPVTEDLARRVLSLPVHPALTPADLKRVAESVRSTVESLN